MTFELIGVDDLGRSHFKGLAADTRPNGEIGSTYMITDGLGGEEKYYGPDAGWIKTQNGGKSLVDLDNAASLPLPSTLNPSSQLNGAAAGDIFDADVSNVKYSLLNIVANTGGVDVHITLDGTNRVQVPVYNVTSQAYAANIPASTTGLFIVMSPEAGHAGAQSLIIEQLAVGAVTGQVSHAMK